MSAEIDPKGLIREAYRIDGIGEAECRSILVDWALSLSDKTDARRAIAAHYEHYSQSDPEHPMTTILREGLRAPRRPARRSGRRTGGRSGEG